MPLTQIKASFPQLKAELSRMLAEGIANPTVHQMAEIAVAGKSDQIAAIYDFVKANFAYVPDPEDMELFIAPKRMAESYFAGNLMGGDCDDMSLLNAGLLGSRGYQARIVILDSDFDDKWDHAICEVYSPFLSDWVAVDTTDKYPLGWTFEVGKKALIYPKGGYGD